MFLHELLIPGSDSAADSKKAQRLKIKFTWRKNLRQAEQQDVQSQGKRGLDVVRIRTTAIASGAS